MIIRHLIELLDSHTSIQVPSANLYGFISHQLTRFRQIEGCIGHNQWFKWSDKDPGKLTGQLFKPCVLPGTVLLRGGHHQHQPMGLRFLALWKVESLQCTDHLSGWFTLKYAPQQIVQKYLTLQFFLHISL